MAKRTKTMTATLKEAKKMIRKPKKARTSTIDQTVADANKGLKRQKKVTKTKTMVATLDDAGVKAPKAPRKPRQAGKKQVKKARKAEPKKVAKKVANKGKRSKKWFIWSLILKNNWSVEIDLDDWI